MAKLLVLHGPNLNLLGTREPEVYGRTTLAEIDAALAARAERTGHVIECLQTNSELALIERIQNARADGTDFILINPAAFTHTSVAIRDALAAVAIPFVEVHLSNPHAREPFRHTSFFSDLAVGTVAGFGADSYRYALEAALARLAADQQEMTEAKAAAGIDADLTRPSTLKDRLEKAMQGPPAVRVGELARACKVASPSVSDWLSGRTKSLEGANLLAAARKLNVSPDWLATGDGPMRLKVAPPYGAST